MKKLKRVFVVAISILLSLSVLSSPVMAKNYAQQTVSINYSYPNIYKVSNTKKYYSSSKNFSSNINLKRMTYGFKAGTKKYSFKTKWFLPATDKSSGDVADVQCFSFDKTNKYLFVVVSGRGSKKDKQVRIFKLKASKIRTSAPKSNWIATLKKCIVKRGPYLTVGHGQGLALDHLNNKLYILSDYKKSKQIAEICEINQTTLKIVNRYPFKIKVRNYTISNAQATRGQYVYRTSSFRATGKNFDFDDEGNFYFNVSPTKNMYFFKGIITNNAIQLKMSRVMIKNTMGDDCQGLKVYDGRIYCVYNGRFMSFPISKLGWEWEDWTKVNPTSTLLKASDIKYTVVNTKREFENIEFDKNGKMYILLVRSPEIIKQK